MVDIIFHLYSSSNFGTGLMFLRTSILVLRIWVFVVIGFLVLGDRGLFLFLVCLRWLASSSAAFFLRVGVEGRWDVRRPFGIFAVVLRHVQIYLLLLNQSTSSPTTRGGSQRLLGGDITYSWEGWYIGGDGLPRLSVTTKNFKKQKTRKFPTKRDNTADSG
jgi:hypothetical protein